MKTRLTVLLTLLIDSLAVAQTPEEQGLAIAIEADNTDQGYVDSSANMKMTLRNRAGKESTRNVRVKTLEVTGDGDRVCQSLMNLHTLKVRPA